MSRATRRDLLGAGTAAALVAVATAGAAQPTAASPPPGPDALLIALCERFMALQVEIDAANRHDADPTDEEMNELVGSQARIMDEMNGLTATTLAGHRARAATLEKWYTRGREGEFDSVVEWDRIGPLFRDLLGVQA